MVLRPASAKLADRPSLPLQHSVGYQIRATHRLVQRALQARIEPHGVTLGMWYYLRVLWDHDGLTQRELSRFIGTMEPTTLSAIAAMEKEGFVRRVRNAEDKRKINVYLTRKGRDLGARLLPLAIEVVDTATRSLSRAERDSLVRMLHAIQRDLQTDLNEVDETLQP